MYWDLHCDLPIWLVHRPGSSAGDAELPCNLHALQQGQIAHQVCAIFTGNEEQAWSLASAQVQQLASLQAQHPVAGCRLLWSIENAHAWFDQGAEVACQRLLYAKALLGPCCYCSLTWNGANRLGGGTSDETGLTPLGRSALALLTDLQIPLDLAHASDRLAQECIDFLDSSQPDHPILVSHANCRSVCPHPRNVPDWLLDCLLERQGLLGLCWVRPFLGETKDSWRAHVEYLLARQSESLLAIGTDLFGPMSYPRAGVGCENPFFEGLNSSACLPAWMEECATYFGTELAEQMGFGHAQAWYARHLSL